MLKLVIYKAFEQVKQKEKPINNLSFINIQPEMSIFFFSINEQFSVPSVCH